MADTNHSGPTYYRRGSIQVWDFIRDQGLNFHLGNAIKYISRAGYKDSKIDDLRKAIHYLQNELENEILSERTSAAVSHSFPRLEQPVSLSEAYAVDFDR